MYLVWSAFENERAPPIITPGQTVLEARPPCRSLLSVSLNLPLLVARETAGVRSDFTC